MSKYIYLFNLDYILTKEEILSSIEKKYEREWKMKEVGEETCRGVVPYKQIFLERIGLLKDISVSEISKHICNIPMNKELVDFITRNHNRCYIITSNLDVWIHELMESLGLSNHYFSSKAIVTDDKIEKVISVIDKQAVCKQFVEEFIAVGEGNNDAEMIEMASIGIGYGGNKEVEDSVLNYANYAIYEESKLCQFLERLL